MKKLLAIVAISLLPAVGFSQQLPDVIGTIETKAGGIIVLTTSMAKHCGDDRFVAYARQSDGKVVGVGCYNMVGQEFFVEYVDGQVYSYPNDMVKPSEEFLRYLAEKERVEKSQSTNPTT